MSRMSVAGIVLVGLVACSKGAPKQAAPIAGTPTTQAHAKPVTQAHAKPVAHPVATRTPVARTPRHQTAGKPDTTSRNPLTNH